MTRYNRFGWIKESDKIYSQGVFYKENYALIRVGKVVKLRNTWSGNEKILGRFKTVKQAKAFMNTFMSRNRI